MLNDSTLNYFLILLTILHLSDLHRSENTPVSNNLLLSSILIDMEKHEKEDPAIKKCDIVIITGDIITGAQIDDHNYHETLTKQYKEAKNFLERLSEVLFDGDISRIFIVPGNHDVCWQIAKQAMESVETKDRKNILELLESPNSPYRWSWEDQKLYRINDLDLYNQRFKFFKTFFDDLYKNQGYVYSLDEKNQFVNFIAPEKKAVFTGFNSLYGNDCYDRHGRIYPDNIANNWFYIKKISLTDIPIKIAFWHHGLESSEYGIDHLNRFEILPLLIDRGYVLGLHGHQHRSNIVSYNYIDPKRFMPIISCGSLCADPRQLPSGYRRQYNIIELDELNYNVKIHVREWFDNAIFLPAKLHEFGGKSWCVMDLPLLQEAVVKREQRMSNIAPLVERAELLIRDGKFREALTLLRPLPADIPIVNRLLIECLYELALWDELIKVIQMPKNPDELGMIVDAYNKKALFQLADEVIERYIIEKPNFDKGFIDSLKIRVKIETELGKVKTK